MGAGGKDPLSHLHAGDIFSNRLHFPDVGISGAPGIRAPRPRLEDLRLLAGVVGQLGAGTDERALGFDQKLIRPQALVELYVPEFHLILAGHDDLLYTHNMFFVYWVFLKACCSLIAAGLGLP